VKCYDREIFLGWIFLIGRQGGFLVVKDRKALARYLPFRMRFYSFLDDSVRKRLEARKTRRSTIHEVPDGEAGVGWEGLEPSTNALKGRCSTIELPTRKRLGIYSVFRIMQY
jgi:hypothetical protein